MYFHQKQRIPFSQSQEEQLKTFLEIGYVFTIIGLEASGYNNKIERYLYEEKIDAIVLNCRFLTRGITFYTLLHISLANHGMVSENMVIQSIFDILKLTNEKLYFLIENVENLIQMHPSIIYDLVQLNRVFPEKVQVIFTGNQELLRNDFITIPGIDALLRNYIVNESTTYDDFIYAFVESSNLHALPSSLLREAYELTGGYLGSSWILSHDLKISKQKRITQVSEFINENHLKIQFERLYASFSHKEKHLLHEVVFNSITIEQIKQEYLYLFQVGLFKSDGTIFSPLFYNFLRKRLQKTFNLNDELIRNVEKILTLQEFNIFKILFIANGTYVSRETIAEIMWGEASNEKYSDWAINQAIKRIREKIITLPNCNVRIETLKGKGYIMSTQKQLKT